MRRALAVLAVLAAPLPALAAEGTCAAWGEPEAVAAVADPGLVEISDIVPSRRNPGLLWVHEDSGRGAVLTAIDRVGTTVGTLTLQGVANRDWEDLAISPCGDTDCIWVGDIGDNALVRGDVAVLRVEEPLVEGPFALTATPEVFPFHYPKGPQNAEGLAIGADGLPLVVTKRVDATAGVYRFPTLDPTREVTLRHVADVRTGWRVRQHDAQATSADVSPDGARLLVRTYGNLIEYPLVDGVPGRGRVVPSPAEPQGEAAAYDADGLWLVSEGEGPPLWFVGCER